MSGGKRRHGNVLGWDFTRLLEKPSIAARARPRLSTRGGGAARIDLTRRGFKRRAATKAGGSAQAPVGRPAPATRPPHHGLDRHSMTDAKTTRRMANAIRALAMDAVEKANSGHPGMPMGMADVATVLFTKILKYDATDPYWVDRDRFVLSAGHGSMLLYALLHLTGSKEMTVEQLKAFRQVGSKTPGHPERGHTESIETTTGPLGQGVSNAVGMALAERILAAEYPTVFDHRTFALCSDGDLMEGISQEAIAIAGHYRLAKLVFLYDDNSISIDGDTALSDSVDQIARFKACGWNAVRVDGHDCDAVEVAIKATGGPTGRR
jgi:transketolase